jgi:DNA-binding transcriptional regulator YdaS (Cro superfamily)
MDIASYYSQLPLGGRQTLAAQIGISPAFLYQIATGRRPAPATLCRDIEKSTDGKVTLHELRPDIFGPPSSKAA